MFAPELNVEYTAYAMFSFVGSKAIHATHPLRGCEDNHAVALVEVVPASVRKMVPSAAPPPLEVPIRTWSGLVGATAIAPTREPKKVLAACVQFVPRFAVLQGRAPAIQRREGLLG